jgi:hypothetical protein
MSALSQKQTFATSRCAGVAPKAAIPLANAARQGFTAEI